jgi:hypothetical protein
VAAFADGTAAVPPDLASSATRLRQVAYGVDEVAADADIWYTIG